MTPPVSLLYFPLPTKEEAKKSRENYNQLKRKTASISYTAPKHATTSLVAEPKGAVSAP
jgi:hypothetical protein